MAGPTPPHPRPPFRKGAKICKERETIVDIIIFRAYTKLLMVKQEKNENTRKDGKNGRNKRSNVSDLPQRGRGKIGILRIRTHRSLPGLQKTCL